ncbi:MAG: glycosyltransferase family 2 protein [Pseudobdellovibrio sp.]
MDSIKTNVAPALDFLSVSVVIVNHNAGPYLTKCVESGLEQAGEIIVIDNGSTDQSVEHLESQVKESDRLKIVRTNRNLGFAAACLIGVEKTTKDNILFLNPDCELNPGSLRRLVSALMQDSKIGMVGGFLTDPDGTEQGGGRRAIPTPWRSFVRAFGLFHFADRWPKLFFDFHLHNQPLPETPIEVEAISGALMLVRREAIAEVGSWDTGYFLHCEDLDWCMRFRQKGWKILFIPDAPVVHHKGVCSRARPIFVEWHKHKGMNRFYNKFFRHQYPGVIMWLVKFGVWFRFAVVAVYYSAKHVSNMIRSKKND